MANEARRFSELGVSTPDESGARPTSRRASDATSPSAAALHRQWSAASKILAERIGEVRRCLVDERRFDPSVQSDWWVDDLESVREALDDLRCCVARVSAPWLETSGAPLAKYLTAAFVWCGDIAGDVKGTFRKRQLRAERRRVARTSFIDDSEAYIACFLDPFYRASNEACARDTVAGEAIRTSAERLQARIISLEWALRGVLPTDGT